MAEAKGLTDPGIETEIERFDTSLDRFMRYYLVHINPILHRTVFEGRAYSEYEIIVVMALGVIGPARPIDLSRGLKIEKGTLTTLIRRLEALALVEKQKVSGDDRSYRVALTARGAGLRRHLDRQRSAGLKALLAEMDPAGIADAARGLDLLSAYLGAKEAMDAHQDTDAALKA